MFTVFQKNTTKLKTVLSFKPFNQTIMKRLLILILILLGLFFVFFYFSLGSQPKFVGDYDGKNPPLKNSLDSTMQLNPTYKAQYVYVNGQGYILKDRKIVFLIGQDTAQSRKADAIKSVEKELESYWKWQILLGKRNIEDLTNQTSQANDKKIQNVEGISEKSLFSRILDVFKVADAVNVIQDTAKTCDCDDDLLLLSGQDLHLIKTTLNPDGGGPGSTGSGDTPISNEVFLKSQPEIPQAGSGKINSFLVGVIDSGIDFGVESKNIRSNNEMLITPKIEASLNYNFIRNNNEVIDSVKHGTYIARIIVKNSANENLKIVGLKTFNSTKIGNLYDNLCAILYAIKHNIKVVNTSWGASHEEPIPVFDEVLRRAKAANMVIICSAGNDKIDIDNAPYYPACYADHPELGSHVITVTSKYIEDKDPCQNRSSSGKKIDLTYKANNDCTHPIPNTSGTSMENPKSGTSYAAPYVTADVVNYLLRNPTNFSKSGYINSIPITSDIKKY